MSKHAVVFGLFLLMVFPMASAIRSADGESVPEVLLSRQLLKKTGLAVGDLVRLAADAERTRVQTFRIVGSYEPTPDPMRFTAERLEARLHLPDLVSLSNSSRDPAAAESVTAINIKLESPDDAANFARDLAARNPGLIARATSAPDDRSNTFVVLDRFHLAIAIVTLLGSAVFLLALMVMLVDERRGTVGMLRLIGLTRRRILLQVLVEGALIAGAGAVFGILFAGATQGLFNQFFQWRYDTALVFVRITPGIVWRCLLLSVPLGIVVSLAASWSFLRRSVLELVGR